MWDYSIQNDNDIYIDSNGDIALVGSAYNSNDDAKVIQMDIKTGLFMNDFELKEMDNLQMKKRFIEDLFEDDDRIERLDVTIDDENVKIIVAFEEVS